jgi:hypothetical protein
MPNPEQDGGHTRTLRAYVRQWANLVRLGAQHVQRMQKALSNCLAPRYQRGAQERSVAEPSQRLADWIHRRACLARVKNKPA